MTTNGKPATAGSNNLPINFREELEKQSQAIQSKIAQPSGDRVRMIPGRGFALPNGQEGEEIEVAIIDFVSANLYYESGFDRDNPQPPGCFAVGPEPSLLTPVDESPDKQSDTCAACPNNQFGSAGKGKACKNTRLLAVTPISDEGYEGDAPIWILSVPPTSIKAFDAYVFKLSTKQKTLPIGLVTRISLNDTVTYVAPLFEAVRPLDDQELANVFPLREEAMTRLMAVPDFSGFDPNAGRGGRGAQGRSGLGGVQSRRGGR
jgi:hypothetical protein